MREVATPMLEWDAILVDEYQDFTDVDFKIILNCCKKHKTVINKKERLIENLFLAGDKLQQIWENGCSHSWENLGISIRGRSKILKTSYRSPSDIIKIALEFLKYSGLEDEVKQFYEGTEDIEHLNLKEDSFNFDIGWDQEAVTIHSKIKKMILSGILPSDILLISPPGKYFRLIKSVFEDEVNKGLIVGTHNEVKGLEAPYVFLTNLGAFDYVLSKSSKMKAKVIYMCLTRSNQYILISAFKNEGSIRLLKDITSTSNANKNAA